MSRGTGANAYRQGFTISYWDSGEPGTCPELLLVCICVRIGWLTQYGDFLLLVSGLWNQQTPLWRYLVQSGHKTLLFAGVNTDQW